MDYFLFNVTAWLTGISMTQFAHESFNIKVQLLILLEAEILSYHLSYGEKGAYLLQFLSCSVQRA